MCWNTLGKDDGFLSPLWGSVTFFWVALGMEHFCCTGWMCYGFALELSGMNLGSVIFETVDVISRQGLVNAGGSSSKRKKYQFWKWYLVMVGLILTTHVRMHELNFCIFWSVGILKVLIICFCSSFCLPLFYLLYNLWKWVWLCSMSKVPPKEDKGSGILLL